MAVALKDVAERAGCSPSTVSKVIHNRSGVGDDTKRKVEATLRELDFQPRKQHRKVRKSGATIGLIVRMNQTLESEQCYSKIIEGLTRELQDLGCHLLYNVQHETDVDEATFRSSILRRNMDGFVIIGADFDPEFYEKFLLSGIPTVLVDNDSPHFSCINTDNYGGGATAARYLMNQGHRDVLFLAGPMKHNSIRSRYHGFRDTAKDTAAMNVSVYEAPGVSVGDGQRAIATLPKLDATAIFASTDKLAIGAMKALKERGLSIPDDVSLVGFDGIEWTEHTDPPLSTIVTAKVQIGVMAAQLLTNVSSREGFHRVTATVGTTLVERASVKRSDAQ